MNEEQREVAERLADELQRFDGAERESLRDEAAAILRELLAEPQGEPVAWLYESKSGSSFLHRGFTKVRFEADMRASKEYPDGHTMTPLYTHPPPQHKQISDEVVAKLINAEWATSDVPSAWKFARAIERAITGEPT